jgi:UMP-CMP kinase
MRPSIVFVLGAPGSGKGTNCEFLTREFGSKMKHLSAGDLLRAERAKTHSKHKDTINSYLAEGQLVPAAIIVTLLHEAIQAKWNEPNGTKPLFLVDGFPRNQENLDGWNAIVGNSVKIQFMLNLDCSQQECTQRLLNRGRGDDNIPTITKRFGVFHNSTQPIVALFEGKGLVRTVKAEGRRESIYERVRPHFLPLVGPSSKL